MISKTALVIAGALAGLLLLAAVAGLPALAADQHQATTATVTGTRTPRATGAATGTPRATGTVTATVEVTGTAEAAPEETGTAEATPEDTVTAEATPEDTVTTTPRATATVARTPRPAATPTATPGATATAIADPNVNEIMNQVTLVQHHYDPYDDFTWFTCASPGLGVNGVEVDPFGPRYVGPNAGDFDLWGVIGLFRVAPDREITFVPQRPAPFFVDPEGIERERLTLEETLELFANGQAVWIGEHGQAGRIGECDPQYTTPTPDGNNNDNDNGNNNDNNNDNDNSNNNSNDNDNNNDNN